MTKQKSDFEAACEIFFAEYIQPEFCNLTETNNPEKQYMIKELFLNLSEEAKTLAKELYELPDEMFTSSGYVIKKWLIKHMKDKFNWSARKTMEVKEKLESISC